MPIYLSRPQPGEFAPYYADYIAAVPDGDIIDVLATQLTDALTLLRPLSEAQGAFRYQTDKWSVKEVLNHITDCERIFTYRALRIARGDATPLATFYQDAYVAAAHAERQSLGSLLDEFESVRHATLTLFRSFDADVGMCRGVASGMPESVRAMAYIIAGHERHHVTILKERYGVQ
jgi:hypothetical protein